MALYEKSLAVMNWGGCISLFVNGMFYAVRPGGLICPELLGKLHVLCK